MLEYLLLIKTNVFSHVLPEKIKLALLSSLTFAHLQGRKMVAKRADEFLSLLIFMFTVSFLARKPSFCTLDGISLTLNGWYH